MTPFRIITDETEIKISTVSKASAKVRAIGSIMIILELWNHNKERIKFSLNLKH